MVNFKLTVVIPKHLKEAGLVAPQVVTKWLRWAMNASVLTTETKIKEYVTEIGLVDTGLLRGRIHGNVKSVSVYQTVGEVATNNVKYARIHEYGGTIRAKNGGALAVPWNKESALLAAGGSLRRLAGLFVIRKDGKALLVSSQNARIGWTLVKSVTIREKRYMRTGLDRAKPDIFKFFRVAAQKAMSAVFGKGEG